LAATASIKQRRKSAGMTEEDPYKYQEWIADAMRHVLRRALDQLAAEGPEGEHHFYINFRTDHEEVGIPGFLKAQYPEEIVIVLQHQFENLLVADDGFEVTLSFSGKKHRLYVPFTAVTAFSDPSVNFTLQVAGTTLAEEPPQEEADIKEFTAEEPAPQQAAATASEAPAPETSGDEASDNSPQTADVISIEAFRKK
jgi:hypothetical protein